MPGNPRRPRGPAQERIARENAKRAAREYREYQKQIEREKKALRRAEDKRLRDIMRASEKVGLYNPKSRELTKSRRAMLRKLDRDFGDVLNKDDFIFAPAPRKGLRTILRRASGLELKTSKTGVFVPRQGHKSASIKVDRKHKDFFIERHGKTKRGPNKGRYYRDIIPLASADELDKERDRLRRMAKRLGKLKGEQMLAFEIHENGSEGFSKNVYEDIERLLAALEDYPKDVAARVNFYRHIRIVKTDSQEQWAIDHPPREHNIKYRQRIRRGRYDTTRSRG